jgi:hypothetical protein
MGAPNGTTHPTYVAKVWSSSTFTDPGTCAAANDRRSRPSTIQPPASWRRATSAGPSATGIHGPPAAPVIEWMAAAPET